MPTRASDDSSPDISKDPEARTRWAGPGRGRVGTRLDERRRRLRRGARVATITVVTFVACLFGAAGWVAYEGERRAVLVDQQIREGAHYAAADRALQDQQIALAGHLWDADPDMLLAFDQAGAQFVREMAGVRNLARGVRAVDAERQTSDLHVEYSAAARRVLSGTGQATPSTVDEQFEAIEADLSRGTTLATRRAEISAGSLGAAARQVRRAVGPLLVVSQLLVAVTALVIRAYRRMDEQTRSEAEELVRHNAARFEALVDHSADIVMVLNTDSGVSYVSPASRRILGRSPADVMSIPRAELIHPDDLEVYDAARDRCGSAPGTLVGPVAVRLRHCDGTWRWLRMSLSNQVEHPQVGGYVVNAYDVTELMDAEADLAHGATHDSLTGLPNRALFLDRLEVIAARAGTRPRKVAVLFCDLDGFKIVNDSLGHGVGDKVLVRVAERLASAVRPGDTLARFGGDEFVVSCEGIRDEDEARAVAARLAAAMVPAIDVGTQDVFVGVSVGIRVADITSATVLGALISDADAAMYQAKRDGRGAVVVFSEPLRERTQRRLDLESGLHLALERGEFRVHYQPTISLSDGSARGFEALVRWERPGHGLVPPGDFIAIAEETGLIVPIGAWVLEEACRQLRIWQQSTAAPITVAVNVSARQLREPDLVDVVADILDRTGVDARAVCLEITESTIMTNVDLSIRTLQALKDLHVRIAIDDFGTGYSSLNYLRQFPIDVLKIDRSFVTDLGQMGEATAIVTSVIDLARALSLETVAEGVETSDQRRHLTSLGCDVAQGYLWASPAPSDQLDQWLTPSITGPAEPSDHYRVVVADDLPEHRAMVRRILERSDRFTVVAEAVDGQEAINRAAQHRPDLVLLDLSMPNMGGLEALPMILATCPHTKVVVLTGQAVCADDALIPAGAAGLVGKLTTPAQLVEQLLTVMTGPPRAP
jgi:diguanylate cyclase (GGDEF)-like protein/PAS domain S-box-containing protein